jgi:hypothetical protein
LQAAPEALQVGSLLHAQTAVPPLSVHFWCIPQATGADSIPLPSQV